MRLRDLFLVDPCLPLPGAGASGRGAAPAPGDLAGVLVPPSLGAPLLRALRRLTAALDEGRAAPLPFLWIAGPPGSGKSTLLRLLLTGLHSAPPPGGLLPGAARSPRDLAPELRDALGALRARIDGASVVVSAAREGARGASLHAVVLQQLKERLGEPTERRRELSVKDAVEEIFALLRLRAPEKTLSLGIDDVDALAAADDAGRRNVVSFLSHLAQRLKSRAWLVATARDDGREPEDLGPLEALFPADLRLRLDRSLPDVLRLGALAKRPPAEAALRDLFRQRAADLVQHARASASLTEDELVASWPLLPEVIDLLIRTASALRASAAPGGEAPLSVPGWVGEILRAEGLRDAPLDRCVPLDAAFDAARAALDPAVLAAVARIDDLPELDGQRPLVSRVARAVALLELSADAAPVTPSGIARSLYGGPRESVPVAAVSACLAALEAARLAGLTERRGAQLLTASFEPWRRERDDFTVTFEHTSELIRELLGELLHGLVVPRLEGRSAPLRAWYSDGKRQHDTPLLRPPGDAALGLDLRYLPMYRRSDAEWRDRSGRPPLAGRLIWVAAGDPDCARDLSIDLLRARRMIRRAERRAPSQREDLRLLQLEQARDIDLARRMREAVTREFMAGSFYYRGEPWPAAELGAGWGEAALAALARASLAHAAHAGRSTAAAGERLTQGGEPP
ncbi:AAA family ATPase [Sorangium sp. So ce296]|uniref:AAA family ATPase n=1 Tax=Sorangium sp. So ce296 TaxID=3133296 RepID=UPI003F641C22